jgi:hypothetical protein
LRPWKPHSPQHRCWKLPTRCGSQKCEELKVFFFLFLYIYFLHIIIQYPSEITPYGVVVKNVKIKKFFPFFFLYILSSYYHPISLRNYTIRLNNWTLRINSPWSPQRCHLNTPGSTITPRWTTYHKDFTKPNYNPQATQTPSVQYTLNYIHLHSLHFTSTYYIIPAA